MCGQSSRSPFDATVWALVIADRIGDTPGARTKQGWDFVAKQAAGKRSFRQAPAPLPPKMKPQFASKIRGALNSVESTFNCSKN
jgi:hypothetical protein